VEVEVVEVEVRIILSPMRHHTLVQIHTETEHQHRTHDALSAANHEWPAGNRAASTPLHLRILTRNAHTGSSAALCLGHLARRSTARGERAGERITCHGS
jgi:hypothetical protein